MPLKDLTKWVEELNNEDAQLPTMVLIDMMLEYQNFVIDLHILQKLTPLGRERWETIRPHHLKFKSVKKSTWCSYVEFRGAERL